MCLLLLFATAALGWEIPPPPGLPPPPPPLPPQSSQQMQCRHSQATVFTQHGHAVLLALLDLHTGSDCATLTTAGARQMAALAAVGGALSRLEVVPQTRIGLTILDTCSSTNIAQKALIAELVYLECRRSYPLGVMVSKSTEGAISNVAASAKQKIVRIPSSRSPSWNDDSDLMWEALVSLFESTWPSVSVWASTSAGTRMEWLASVTKEKGICLINSSPRNAPYSDVLVVIGSFNENLEKLTLSAIKHRRPGQPLLIVPLDVVLADNAAFVPDNALVLVSTAERILRLAESVSEDREDKNDTTTAKANIENAAAATGFGHFLDVAKNAVRQVDGFAQIVREKCHTKGLCGGLPPSSLLPMAAKRSSDQIFSLLQVRESDLERRSFRPSFLLRRGNSSVAHFTAGSWALEKEIPGPDAYLLCASDDAAKNGGRDCSTCSNFQAVSASAAEAAVDHAVQQIPLNGRPEDDIQVSDSTPPSGPMIVAVSENLVLHWRFNESWVAAVMTVSAVGATGALVVAIFVAARIYKGDILEGNPCASFVLLFAVLFAYAAVIPFCVNVPISARGPWRDILCATRVFGTSTAYSQMFAIMLSRALMLASCDRDGGFLTHVSGYVQSSVCVTLASVPFWAIAAALMTGPASCATLSNGRLYALLLGYDLLLLVLLVASTPFIATSKRNYREGAFFSAAAALCVSVWAAWWALYLSLPSRWHDAATAGGLSGTATAILLAVFIPRTYMMMTAVVRDRLSSALPSLAYSTGGSGLIGGPMYYDTADTAAGPATGTRACDIDEAATHEVTSGTFGRNVYRPRSPGTRTPRALSPQDVTYERYDSPNSPLNVTRF